MPCLTEFSCCSQHTYFQIHFKFCPFVLVFILCSSHLQRCFYITIFFLLHFISKALYLLCDCYFTIMAMFSFLWENFFCLRFYGLWVVFCATYMYFESITPAHLQTIWLLEQARSLCDFLLELIFAFKSVIINSWFLYLFMNTVVNIQCNMSGKMS